IRELLGGYAERLEHGPRPFVLAEDHPRLRDLAAPRLEDPGRYWRKIKDAARLAGPAKLPPPAQALVDRSLPQPTPKYDTSPRVAGKGSLGKPRVLALARDW